MAPGSFPVQSDPDLSRSQFLRSDTASHDTGLCMKSSFTMTREMSFDSYIESCKTIIISGRENTRCGFDSINDRKD